MARLVISRRLFSTSLTPNSATLRAVCDIVKEKAARELSDVESASLQGDLHLKFQVLTACERHFSIAIPHKVLVDLVDARSIAAFVDEAHEVAEASVKEAEQHWSKTLPSNVTIVGFGGKHVGRNQLLGELLTTSVDERRSWNPAIRREVSSKRRALR